MPSKVQQDITAQNTGTTAIQVRASRLVDVSVSGTGVGTVHLQRRPIDDSAAVGDNWRDVESYAANVEKVMQNAGTWELRLFCKTGNFTSGTISLELQAGNRPG